MRSEEKSALITLKALIPWKPFKDWRSETGFQGLAFEDCIQALALGDCIQRPELRDLRSLEFRDCRLGTTAQRLKARRVEMR